MTTLIKINGDLVVGVPVTLADGSQFIVPAAMLVDSAGNAAVGVAKPATSGGLTPCRIFTGTTGFAKSSPGQVYAITAYNANAAARYLHLYNKVSAPTLSTDTPVMTIPLLGASVRDIAITDIGAAFSIGIAWAYTTDDIAIPATAATSTELHATILYA